MVKQDEGGFTDTEDEGLSPDVTNAEILDNMITHRGEIRHRSMSFSDRHQSLSFIDRHREVSKERKQDVSWL